MYVLSVCCACCPYSEIRVTVAYAWFKVNSDITSGSTQYTRVLQRNTHAET